MQLALPQDRIAFHSLPMPPSPVGNPEASNAMVKRETYKHGDKSLYGSLFCALPDPTQSFLRLASRGCEAPWVERLHDELHLEAHMSLVQGLVVPETSPEVVLFFRVSAEWIHNLKARVT